MGFEEKWKIIEEFSKYEISNKGRVRNIANNEISTIVTPNQYGYYKKRMLDDTYSSKYRSIHDLVAKHFVENPDKDNFMVVIHKDGNKLNNSFDNLKWGTGSDFFKIFPKKSSIIDFDEKKIKSLKDEQWKQVEIYDNYYISNYGRVYSCYSRNITNINFKEGENKINIIHNNKTYILKLDILVAKHFIPNLNSYKYLKHTDGDLTNNKFDNLEWTSFGEGKIKNTLVDNDEQNQNGEIWKTLKNHPNYQVSNFGSVRSIFKKENKKPYITTNGFYGLRLWKDNKEHAANIHRLVGEYFVDNPNNSKLIKHKDNNKLNNKYDNLEWVDKIVNINIDLQDKICQIHIKKKVEIVWDSYLDVCKEMDIKFDDLNKACHDGSVLKGYTWKKYVEEDLEGEVWKEWGDYEVSNKGRVRNKNTKKHLTLQTGEDGYVSVGIVGKKTKLIHILVANCFIPKIEGKKFVNHIDGTRSNNNFENLEWVTPKENFEHAIKNKLIGKNYFKQMKIVQKDPYDGRTILIWDDHNMILKYFKITDTELKESIRSQNILKGYNWEFYSEKNIVLKEEIWKDLCINDTYRISNYGRIKNKHNKFLKLSNQVYKILSFNGKFHKVHRLVARTFLENPKKLPFVNHKDGDKYNNFVDNLEWISISDNNKHAVETGLVHYSKAKKINQYSLDGTFLNTFNSIREAMRAVGISKSSIAMMLKGKFKQSGGFIWKYCE